MPVNLDSLKKTAAKESAVFLGLLFFGLLILPFAVYIVGKSVFGEYGVSVRMVRTERWKYIERADEGPWQLFDLAADPGEKINLCGNPEHADIQATFEQRLHEFFAAYSDPLWNLWKPDGTSKHLHTKKRPRRIGGKP